MSDGYYNKEQTKQIEMAIDHDLSIGQLMVMSDLDESCKTEEYPAGVPLYTAKQMEQIRKGFEDGLDYGEVFLYSDPELSPEQMEQIRMDCAKEENKIDKPFRIDQAGIRLVRERKYYSETPITNPDVAVRIIGEELRQYDRELVAVVNCTSALKPINVSICSMGTINKALISPRELLKTSILSNSSCVVLMHSHPSGDPKPSRIDLNITERLKKAYEMMDIQLVDHVIVGDKELFSFQEHGLMEKGAMHREMEYKYRVDVREGWWMSCKVFLEDEYGELHDTGQERFFANKESATEYKKLLEGGADESIAYYNSLGLEREEKRHEGLEL